MALALPRSPTLWAGQAQLRRRSRLLQAKARLLNTTPLDRAPQKAAQSPKQQSPDLSLEPAPVLPEGNATGPLFRPPILIAPAPGPPPPLSGTVRERSLKSASEVIKVYLGLVFIFGLAYLAGSWVQALEKSFKLRRS